MEGRAAPPRPGRTRGSTPRAAAQLPCLPRESAPRTVLHSYAGSVSPPYLRIVGNEAAWGFKVLSCETQGEWASATEKEGERAVLTTTDFPFKLTGPALEKERNPREPACLRGPPSLEKQNPTAN